MSLALTVVLGIIAFGICALLLRRELRRRKEMRDDSSKEM